jgi:gluconate 2-dehydrogenase gamma chain
MADELKFVTRRDLLKSAGLMGAAAAAPLGALASADAGPAEAGAADAAQRAATANAAGGRALETLEALTAAEADTLEAICARLIPTDATGPGAREARAARYIDRALAGALAASREAYRAGLAALDRYARQSRGKPFHELPATDQDSVLMDVESNSVTPGIFAGSSGTFFNLVRTHTLQGTFGDPYYGGNANFIGWDLIGYPGIRTAAVTAEDQRRMERNELRPTHRSAYDNDMYNKATVSAEPHDSTRGGHGHAD